MYLKKFDTKIKKLVIFSAAAGCLNIINSTCSGQAYYYAIPDQQLEKDNYELSYVQTTLPEAVHELNKNYKPCIFKPKAVYPGDKPYPEGKKAKTRYNLNNNVNNNAYSNSNKFNWFNLDKTFQASATFLSKNLHSYNNFIQQSSKNLQKTFNNINKSSNSSNSNGKSKEEQGQEQAQEQAQEQLNEIYQGISQVGNSFVNLFAHIDD